MARSAATGGRPGFQLERPLWHDGYDHVAGVDEVGRGPLAGPVVAAAVVFPPGGALPPALDGLDDSKRLSAHQRQALVPVIETAALAVAVAQVGCREIDALNIRQAALLAMSRAVAGLSLTPSFVLVDGRDLPAALPCPARPVIRGDTLSLSIAAASIVAKEFRDRLMRELDAAHPGYGWAHNAGYPTQEHRQALERLGVTAHHRRSFAPIRNMLDGRAAD